MLAQPVLPLARLAGMLFLTGPFTNLTEVVQELNDKVETGGITYADPAASLTPYLPAMAPFERLKTPQPPARIILSAQAEALDAMEAIDAWVAQNILSQELEAINSQLCGPCNCRLCCIGPGQGMGQQFFEIPLQDNEIPLFQLEKIDSSQSRASSSQAETALLVDGQPFYEHDQARLIHWQQSWGLILPTGSSCPQLDDDSGGCTIYPQRPDVCRRPQIFAYALERQPAFDSDYEGTTLPAYLRQQSLLAIWDCPYVQQFQDEIGSYGQACGMEPIFKENKR